MAAELAAAMPEDGGYVVWVQRAFGRFWAFQEGWWSWLCSFADNALYPVMFVDYLAYLHGGMPPVERWLIGVGMIVLVAGLNIRGTQLVGRSAVVFTVLVLAPFIALVFLGARHVDPFAWLARPKTVEWGLLLSTMLWNTCGGDNAACCAGEVQQPGTGRSAGDNCHESAPYRPMSAEHEPGRVTHEGRWARRYPGWDRGFSGGKIFLAKQQRGE